MDTPRDKVVLIMVAGKAARQFSQYGIQIYAVENTRAKLVETMFALVYLQTEVR